MTKILWLLPILLSCFTASAQKDSTIPAADSVGHTRHIIWFAPDKVEQVNGLTIGMLPENKH